MKKRQLIARIATLEKELAEMKRQRDVLAEGKDNYATAEVRMLSQKRLEEYQDKAFRRRWTDGDSVLRANGLYSQIIDKPPLGLRPKFIWIEERIKEIQEAIKRYEAANKVIPEEWYIELGKLLYSPGQ